MAALSWEEENITQPHTSAGQIPTDKGYRLFVDRTRRSSRCRPRERSDRRAFLNGTADVDDLMARTGAAARATRQVAIVQYPLAQRSVVRHVDLVPLTPHRLLVIVVQSTGRVDQTMLEITNLDDDLQGVRAGSRRHRRATAAEAAGVLGGLLVHRAGGPPVRRSRC